MDNPVPYDEPYFDKYVLYEDTPVALKINEARISLVNRHVGPDVGVLDIGIGSGEFLKKRGNTFGYDVNPKAIKWLKERRRWSDSFAAFDAFTFWDVIEHVPEPESYFRKIPVGGWAFFSIPVFDNLKRIRESKHYRPNEHFYYFTKRGFVDWMCWHGFAWVETSDAESKAGRDSILSFAFRKVHD
jgi:hypothetical protein